MTPKGLSRVSAAQKKKKKEKGKPAAEAATQTTICEICSFPRVVSLNFRQPGAPQASTPAELSPYSSESTVHALHRGLHTPSHDTGQPPRRRSRMPDAKTTESGPPSRRQGRMGKIYLEQRCRRISCCWAASAEVNLQYHFFAASSRRC